MAYVQDGVGCDDCSCESAVLHDGGLRRPQHRRHGGLVDDESNGTQPDGVCRVAGGDGDQAGRGCGS